jgi:hypothetical protein
VNTIDWLLDSDPAISWQVMSVLTDAPPEAIAALRARAPREGLGVEILVGADTLVRAEDCTVPWIIADWEYSSQIARIPSGEN